MLSLEYFKQKRFWKSKNLLFFSNSRLSKVQESFKWLPVIFEWTDVLCFEYGQSNVVILTLIYKIILSGTIEFESCNLIYFVCCKPKRQRVKKESSNHTNESKQKC